MPSPVSVQDLKGRDKQGVQAEIEEIDARLHNVAVCSRRERQQRQSELKKRKRDEDDTNCRIQKIRKVDKDELTYRVEIECRLVGRLIEEIDSYLEEYKKENGGKPVWLIHRQTTSVDELLGEIDRLLCAM